MRRGWGPAYFQCRRRGARCSCRSQRAPWIPPQSPRASNGECFCSPSECARMPMRSSELSDSTSPRIRRGEPTRAVRRQSSSFGALSSRTPSANSFGPVPILILQPPLRRTHVDASTLFNCPSSSPFSLPTLASTLPLSCFNSSFYPFSLPPRLSSSTLPSPLPSPPSSPLPSSSTLSLHLSSSTSSLELLLLVNSLFLHFNFLVSSATPPIHLPLLLSPLLRALSSSTSSSPLQLSLPPRQSPPRLVNSPFLRPLSLRLCRCAIPRARALTSRLSEFRLAAK